MKDTSCFYQVRFISLRTRVKSKWFDCTLLHRGSWWLLFLFPSPLPSPPNSCNSIFSYSQSPSPNSLSGGELFDKKEPVVIWQYPSRFATDWTDFANLAVIHGALSGYGVRFLQFQRRFLDDVTLPHHYRDLATLMSSF